MKQIFETIMQLLTSVQALKYIDLDKGQIDQYDIRPAIAFPAALISLEIMNADDETDTLQRVQLQITIRVAFDFSPSTSAIAPADVRSTNLQFFDVVDGIYHALQGYTDETIDSISRLSLRNELRL
ncbi:hypothetical protein [Thermoflavifilum thermophilum]|uniref:Uncharacterized protein n=1 Tax=Thermoflavifilum thermophilum TaxID=1393122 RepID=A0A1I7NCA5_9BACT|nr:hypothetical protein [Thermoflavifilum thermophilum]SFV32300.1 hypothetical protein SAMN05660895_1299 [Thermoflavifilum thermophilum]